MIVCICNCLNEKCIKQAIKQGAQCPRDIYRHCGVEIDCGQCMSEIATLLAEIKETEIVE